MAIIDVIKYEGPNDVLVWKHPREDFNTDAQLIVHQSQEAILFNSGNVSDPYTAGKYTIETENIPGVRGLVSLVTGGVSPNHYEIYFINRAYSMDVFWGSNSPWMIQDPSLQMPFHMRARGQFAVRVEDSKKLVLKLVGTSNSFTQKALREYFRGILMRDVKSFISSFLSKEQLMFTQITEKLKFISEGIEPELEKVFNKYGLHMEDFAIESIDIVQDDAYNRIREAMTKRGANIMEGVSEKERLAFGVAEKQASNPGTGNFTNSMFGLGAGLGAMPSVATMTRNIADTVMKPITGMSQNKEEKDPYSVGVVKKRDITLSSEDVICPTCGKATPKESKFCKNCGNEIIITEGPTCRNCKSPLPPGSMFCNICGTKVESENTDEENKE